MLELVDHPDLDLFQEVFMELMVETHLLLLLQTHIIFYQRAVVVEKNKVLHLDHLWLQVDLVVVALVIELDHQTQSNLHKTLTTQIF